MTEIVALSMNPSIDVSTSVDKVAPIHKLRCTPIRRDAGGGGINVARVVRRLGADVTAIYPVGGAMGQLLRRLVDEEKIRSLAIHIATETRESFVVAEERSGLQYRFVLPGPQLTESESAACFDALVSLEQRPRFVVVSGSLPPGIPENFYARAARLAKEWKARLVLDTSGPALKAALEEGVYLVKPSLRELNSLIEAPAENEVAWVDACRAIVARGGAEIVALTLGDRGALLVTHDCAWRAAGLPIKAVSAVGAGDSFLGAMIWSLVSNEDMERAFRYGIAAGTAALMTPGTELCLLADVERLVYQVTIKKI